MAYLMKEKKLIFFSKFIRNIINDIYIIKVDFLFEPNYFKLTSCKFVSPEPNKISLDVNYT